MYSKQFINPLILIKIISLLIVLSTTNASSSKFIVVPKNCTIVDGKSIKLNCKSSMEEKHEYSWNFNGHEIKLNHRVVQIKSNLLIVKANKTLDVGEYVCIATSSSTGAREASPSAFLYPATSSDIDESALTRGKRGDATIDGQSRLNVHENLFTQIPCNFLQRSKTKNLSQLKVKWQKDGKLFREININRQGNGNTLSESKPPSTLTSGNNMEGGGILTDESRVYINQLNGSLIFTSTTASDEGLYVCQIFGVGIETLTLNQTILKIIENLKFAPQPTSKNLELGTVGKVHCRAQGTPSPQIKWIAEGGDQLPPTIEDRNGTLVFQNVTASQTGNYTCIAKNLQGEISATVSITVVVAPRFSVFNEGPINVTEMGDAMLHCQATGDPAPTIQWDKDLKYLSGNDSESKRYEVLENGTLLLHKVHLEDEGQYGCTIGNSGGLKREEIQLVVKPSEVFNTDETTDGFIITRAVLITMTVACAYIIFVVALMIWCRYKRSKRRERSTIMSKQTEETCDEDMDKEIDPCLIEKSEKVSPKSNSRSHHKNSEDGLMAGNHVNEKNSKNHKQRQLNTNYEKISRADLTQVHQLGRGQFGDVLIMKLNSVGEKIKNSENDTDEIKIEDASPEVTVLVKTLKKTKDENLCNEFKRQLDMFGNLNNENISKFYGLCQEENFHGMVIEWTDWGDFKQFLVATMQKDDSPTSTKSRSPPLKMAQMLTAAHQISKGLDAIYRARFIHKDIATRNCIISSNFCVKISYPALCKDKYNREYYKHLNELIPLRWMAPECLHDDDYSIKSDVYSFGILVWEIFTHACNLPCESMSNEDFLKALKEKTLERELAENTPDELRDILKSCWVPNPKERPSFSHLITSVGTALNNEVSRIKAGTES